MSGPVRVGFWCVLTFCSAALCGCDALLTAAIIHAPNRDKKLDLEDRPATRNACCTDTVREGRITVGPPEASLQYWIIDPEESEDRPAGEPQSTVLVLHGYRASSLWVRGVGRRLAKGGYRAVMLDLRGHGKSTGDYISYGVQESRDVRQVIDHLYERGQVAGPLGIWGISMGAATAIHAAALDERIEAVVAVAPFTSMHDVVPHVVRRLLPVFGWFVSDRRFAELTDEAAEKAGFDAQAADTVAAIRQVRVPVLIIHGKGDAIVPLRQGRELHNAAPHGEMVEMGWTGHISAHFSGAVERTSLEWFDRQLKCCEAP